MGHKSRMEGAKTQKQNDRGQASSIGSNGSMSIRPQHHLLIPKYTSQQKEMKRANMDLSKTCVCGKMYKKGEFKVCGGCKCHFYCSKACQARAWKTHKKICVGLDKKAMKNSQISKLSTALSIHSKICPESILDAGLVQVWKVMEDLDDDDKYALVSMSWDEFCAENRGRDTYQDFIDYHKQLCDDGETLFSYKGCVILMARPS